MNAANSRKNQAKVLRIFRKIHRYTGATLFLFFFVISVSGLLLGWKKNSNGWLLADTQKGTTTEFSQWLPLEVLTQKAQAVMKDSVSAETFIVLDRIDIRKDKGVIKFNFDGYYGLQLDGATGEVLQFGKRNADLVENIHDGSILDAYFNISGGYIKLFYTTIMSVALLIFTITGFWLWYGPKRMRNTT